MPTTKKYKKMQNYGKIFISPLDKAKALCYNDCIVFFGDFRAKKAERKELFAYKQIQTERKKLMKKGRLGEAYEKARLDIVVLDTRDIICTSEPQDTITELGSSGNDPSAWL